MIINEARDPIDAPSIQELENVKDVYNYLEPICKKAATPSTFSRIQKEVSKFLDKNEAYKPVLQTNIVGRQLLFNERVQEDIYKIIGIDSKELGSIVEDSQYFEQFKSSTKAGKLRLVPQLVSSFPFIIMAGEYFKKNRKREAEFMYFLAFLRPYATRVARYFPYGVNDDQMLYTVENLSERYDIKKQKTLFNTLIKMSKSSFDNYVDDLQNDPSDRRLHVIFSSGIYSRINNFLFLIAQAYHKNKGKYLPFETGTFEGTDDSEGETFEKDIQSDAAIKNQMVRKAVNTMNNRPINSKYLELSARYGFISSKAVAGTYKFSSLYTDILKNTIDEVSHKMFRKLPLFFESLISSFLYELNTTTKQKYTSADLKTPVFVAASRKIFKSSPNTKNENIIRVRNMINEMLETCSTKYLSYGPTQQRNLRNALHFYFVLLVQKG